jgi:diguanylate cyclase (GGDEF)-like protein
LQPGGLSVHPLVISDKLLGVLELISRDDDEHFEENQELFGTIAEHLALALNSAMLFESFERMATHDALTGIANHRTMQEFLQRRFAEAQRVGQEMGLLMIDVDHVRSFNEEEGHDAGDEVLRLVSDALKAAVRPYDLAARYGGEEFTVVMPGSSMSSSLAVAERIRKRVSQISFTTSSGRDRHVTVSIGCACFPKNAKDPASLLKAADSALYQAKRAGRNRVLSYKGAYSHRKHDNLNLERVWEWVPDEDKDKAKEVEALVMSQLDLLRESVALSRAQQQILQGLAILATTYRRMRAGEEIERIAELESWEEFRILQPSLDALDERFDGKGPQGLEGARIPFLSRILSVLLAIAEDRGKPLLEDASRFDPEIVTVLSELDDAA